MELQRLKFLQELFSKEENWTKGAYARNADGNAVLPINDPTAKCWCTVGAIQLFNEKNKVSASERANPTFREVMNEKWPFEAIATINDEQGREAILAVLKEAIQRIESKGTTA